MKQFIIFMGMLLFIAGTADAQINRIGDKLRRKVEDKVEKKIWDKIEKEIDGDSQASEKPDSTGTAPASVDLGKLFGSGKDLELEKSYDFDFAIDYLVTTKDSEKPTEMTQLYASAHHYLGMLVKSTEKGKEGEVMPAIFDLDRSYFIVIQDASDQAVVFKMNPSEEEADSNAGNQEENFSLQKTSITKTIAGYPCVKYLYEGSQGTGEMWVTQDIDYKSFDLFEYFKKISEKNNVKRSSVWDSGIEGVVLQMKGIDENGDAYEMVATEVHEDASIQFDMAKYSIMDLSGIGN